MVFANLFPVGVLQLADVVTNGYWHARSLEFFEQHAYLEWLRLPGDGLFIAAVLPLVYLTAKAALMPRKARAARRTAFVPARRRSAEEAGGLSRAPIQLRRLLVQACVYTPG